MLRALLTGAALLAGAALFAAPAPRRGTVYVLEGPGQQHAFSGPTVPILVLPGNGYNLFDPTWDARAAVERARPASGPFLVGVWANNVRERRALCRWDDAAGWETILSHVRDLGDALRETGGVGLILDSEIYTSTPHNNGGAMRAGAWPRGGRERGRQLDAALGPGLLLGQYVWVEDARKQPGWGEFWGGAYRRGDLLLDEGPFLGADLTRAFGGRGVRTLPGRRRYSGPGHYWIYP